MAPKIERPSSSSSSNKIDEAVGLLSSATAEDLTMLEDSLSEDTISLQWCCQAINFLNTMHSQFFTFIEESEIPKSWDGVKCMDLYMEETLSLMDFCNLLKLAFSVMDRYRLIAQFVAEKSSCHELPLAKIKSEIENLESESRKLYGFERWKDINFSKSTCIPKSKSKDQNVHVINVFRAIMGVISMLVFSVIFYPIKVKLDQKIVEKFPQLESISNSLENLVKDDSRPILIECKMIEKAILDIKTEILQGDDAKSSDLLQSNSMALKHGLQLFENAVNELFGEVSKGRSRVLAILQ